MNSVVTYLNFGENTVHGNAMYCGLSYTGQHVHEAMASNMKKDFELYVAARLASRTGTDA